VDEFIARCEAARGSTKSQSTKSQTAVTKRTAAAQGSGAKRGTAAR
jgi:hypothetical protein